MVSNRSAASATGARAPASLTRLRFDAPQRFLLACGLVLIASGIVHGVMLLVTGGSFDGPLSWRKPFLFGISFGLTAATVAVVATTLRLRATIAWMLLGSLGLASVAETGLITMQTWRGVPSHFNFATSFDAMVFTAMGLIVSIVATALLILAVLSFLVMRPIPLNLAWAIRIGMVLLIVGQVLGALIIASGISPAATGNDAAVFGPHGVMLGEAGILKYPHGIAMHAIQVLPVIAVLGLGTRWSRSQQLYAVAAASLGYILIVTVSTIQAYTGRGGLTLSWLELGVLILGVVLLVGAGVASIVAVNWHQVRARRHAAHR